MTARSFNGNFDFREGDAGVPPTGAVHLWSENQQRVLRPVDPVGEHVEPQRIW